MSGSNNCNYSTSAGSSKSSFPANPATVSLYSTHSDAYNFVAPKCLPSVSSYMTQFGNMNNEVIPTRYNETTNSSSVSASFMPYTIEQPQVRFLYNSRFFSTLGKFFLLIGQIFYLEQDLREEKVIIQLISKKKKVLCKFAKNHCI